VKNSRNYQILSKIKTNIVSYNIEKYRQENKIEEPVKNE
jgi:uncharacterized membrane protein